MASFAMGARGLRMNLGHLMSSRYSTSVSPSLFVRCRGLATTRATAFTLNTGAKIPALGLGTFQDAEAQEDTVCRALQQGFRLIDTARVYDVEKQVGKGIKKSGVPREDIFLGTKLWCNDYHPDDVERALDDSLRDLDTPYVDLLMMHYPCTFARGPERFPRDPDTGRMIHGKTTFVDTWKAMERLVKTTDKVKAIGVSNFSKGEIEKLLEEGSMVSVWLSSPRGNTTCVKLTALLRYRRFIKWKSTRTYSKRPSTRGCGPRASTSCSSVLWAT